LNEDFEKRLVELKKKSQKSSFSPSLSPSFQFIDLCEIIKKHQPKYLFFENVANLVTQDTGGMYKTILKSLDRLGYYYPEAPLILSLDKFRVPFLRP
jgi:site-specific DNA-cytosine methylase